MKFGPAALLSVALSGVALAQAPTPTAEATYELAPKEKDSFLKVEGKAPNLPDGTKLHVRMVETLSGVEGAFFSTPITAERFQAYRLFEGRQLAPLSYKITVELILADQRQALAEYIRREWGLPSGARVVLASKDIEIGTAEEQAAFRIESIKTLLGLTIKGRSACDVIWEALQKPPLEDKGALRKQMRELGRGIKADFVQPFDEFRMRYVLLQEQGTVDRLLSVMTSLSEPLQLHNSGETAQAKAKLEGHLATLQRVKEELESRLPKKAGEGKASDGSK